MRYSLEGTVVGQTHKWALNGCSSSRELGAQYVQPHQRPKNTIPAGKKDMPLAPSTQCHVAMRESAEKNSFWLFRTATLDQDGRFQGNTSAAGAAGQNGEQQHGQLFHYT